MYSSETCNKRSVFIRGEASVLAVAQRSNLIISNGGRHVIRFVQLNVPLIVLERVVKYFPSIESSSLFTVQTTHMELQSDYECDKQPIVELRFFIRCAKYSTALNFDRFVAVNFIMTLNRYILVISIVRVVINDNFNSAMRIRDSIQTVVQINN